MTDGSCQSRQHMVTTYGHSSGICSIMITEHDYPSLIAHQLLSKITDELLTLHPPSSLTLLSSDLSFPNLKTYLLQYQDPSQVDSVTEIQRELDETKIVLHKTIESVLERNVKLEDLVMESEGLSAQSEMFYSECSFAEWSLGLGWLILLKSRRRIRIRVLWWCDGTLSFAGGGGSCIQW